LVTGSPPGRVAVMSFDIGAGVLRALLTHAESTAPPPASRVLRAARRHACSVTRL
jgi:hypothetical protein